MSNWPFPMDIDLDQASDIAASLHDAILFGENQNGIELQPIASALAIQALGALAMAQGLFKQASLVRAREQADMLKVHTP
jgi:hypothetical protein